MKIEVIKPQKKVNWKFPCKGISKTDGTIVGFSGYRTGTVLDIGESKYLKLYDIADNWNMDNLHLSRKKNNLLKIQNLLKKWIGIILHYLFWQKIKMKV